MQSPNCDPVTLRTVPRRVRASSRLVPSRRLARATAPARAIALNRSLVRSFLIVDCTCVPDCRCRGARLPILMQNKPAKPPRPVRPRSSFAEMSAGEQHSPMLFALLLACHIERSLVGWRAPRYYGSNACGQSTIINAVTKLRSRNVAHRFVGAASVAASGAQRDRSGDAARTIALNRSLVRSPLIADCPYVPDSRYRGARRPIQTQNKPPTPPRPVRGLNASNAARGRVGGDRPSGRRGTRAVAMALAHSRAHTSLFARRSR